MTNRELIDRVQAEIVRLHREFERWFAAETDDFALIEGSLAPGFTFVAPDAAVIERDPLLSGLRGHHGSRDIPIRIENVRVLLASKEVTVATYEEWHDHGKHSTARQSTVVFTTDDAAPHGLQWHHVQETWKVPPPL